MNPKQQCEFVQKIIHQVREREYPYEKRPKESIVWGDYDRAQCREIADMIDLIRELVNKAEERLASEFRVRPRRPGRTPVNYFDVAKVLLLQSYFRVPNRVAEGLILLFAEKLGLKETFSYKTIERGYGKNQVQRIFDVVFNMTNEPVREIEQVFSVDGSGSPTSNKQNYARDRQIQNAKRVQRKKEIDDSDKTTKTPQHKDPWPTSLSDPKRDYVFKTAIIGTKYKLFAAWKSTTNHSIGETTMFPGVMDQAMKNHPNMKALLGDGLYATRPVCKYVGQFNVTPRFLPRRNVTLQKKGVKEWANMLYDLSKDPNKWLHEYHLRSISETGFSMIHRANPQPLLKRIPRRKETEDFLRGVNHNIKRLCYLKYLIDLTPIQSNEQGIV